MIAAAAMNPLLVSGANRAQAGSSRSTTACWRRARLLGGRLLGVDRGDVQQVGAKPARALDGQAVEVQLVLAAGRGGARADAHGRQAEQPLDRVGRHLHRPDSFQAGGEHVLVDQPATQLDPALADPEARGDVAQDPERDRERDAEQLPGDVRAVRRPVEHEQAHQHREEPQHLADRVDQQHPAVETLPLALVDEIGRRGRHVASPGTTSAWTVSSSASRWAKSRSSPLISRAPAADAVVTVTLASPKSRSIAPSE